ncbi:MAG: hypothetical protein M1838_005227 [Thelocarpon superellum]|nr:MAG: hypothetical protein M1838_005227 [Thelocarpon superellum]
MQLTSTVAFLLTLVSMSGLVPVVLAHPTETAIDLATHDTVHTSSQLTSVHLIRADAATAGRVNAVRHLHRSTPDNATASYSMDSDATTTMSLAQEMALGPVEEIGGARKVVVIIVIVIMLTSAAIVLLIPCLYLFARIVFYCVCHGALKDILEE